VTWEDVDIARVLDDSSLPAHPMEFDLIQRIRARIAPRDDVLLGIGDDAALLQVPAGHALAVSTDSLNIGVHFPQETAADDIGWKSLAVNLSDLAAMGAEPAWCTLSLSLPQADATWLDRFLDGFLALADRHRVSLVGGDTTRGPLSVTITIHGFVPAAEALRRSGARVDDEVWVTGTLGDAAGALAQWRASAPVSPELRARLDRPTPRIAAGLALLGLAHACIDVSDGLLADLGHVLEASGVGARLDAGALPTSDALASSFPAERRDEMQLTGGDDYELCFTAPAQRHDAIRAALDACATPAIVIGRIEAEPGLRVHGRLGGARSAGAGWDHFGGDRQ
jgi:thiamine-monophosphate kinase